MNQLTTPQKQRSVTIEEPQEWSSKPFSKGTYGYEPSIDAPSPKSILTMTPAELNAIDVFQNRNRGWIEDKRGYTIAVLTNIDRSRELIAKGKEALCK